MADNIIKVNFGEADISDKAPEIEQDALPLTYGSDDGVTLARLAANNLKVRMTTPNTGEFMICVDQVDPWLATFRKTDDFWAAWELYCKIMRHVYDGDRTYTELAMMLNNEIK